jgi:hypothetical protein
MTIQKRIKLRRAAAAELKELQAKCNAALAAGDRTGAELIAVQISLLKADMGEF